MTATTLWVLDYALEDLNGREYNYDSALRGACARLQFPFCLLVCKQLDASLCRSLDALPLFTSGWSAFDPAIANGALEELSRLNIEFLEDLAGLTPRMDRHGVVLVPAIRQDKLLGLLTWLLHFPRENSPQVNVLLRQDLSDDPLFRKAVSDSAALGSSLRFFAETEELRQRHSRIGCRVDILPIPLPPPVEPSAATGFDPVLDGFLSAETGPIVGYFGRACPSKGFHMLPEIVEQTLELFPTTRWLIHAPARASQDARMARAFERLQRLAETENTVAWIPHAMPEAEYRSLMCRCDIAALPYLAEAYRTRASVVYAEAVSAGKVVVIPERSWMAEQAEAFSAAAIPFREPTMEAIALAIGKAIAKLPVLRGRAETARAAWTARHSAELLVGDLLGNQRFDQARR